MIFGGASKWPGKDDKQEGRAGLLGPRRDEEGRRQCPCGWSGGPPLFVACTRAAGQARLLPGAEGSLLSWGRWRDRWGVAPFLCCSLLSFCLWEASLGSPTEGSASPQAPPVSVPRLSLAHDDFQ